MGQNVFSQILQCVLIFNTSFYFDTDAYEKKNSLLNTNRLIFVIPKHEKLIK